MTKATPLLPLAQSFLEHDPLSAAQCIETMNDEDALVVLRALPPTLVAKMFPYLQVSIASGLLGQFPSALFNEVVLKLEPNQAAAIILGMEQESQKKLIDHLPDKSREEIRELLTYPQNSAGRLMSTDFLALRQDVSVRDAMQRIRTLAKKKYPASYAYVVDESNHLVGVINMRQLILEDSETPLSSFMFRDVFSVNAFMDIEEVAGEVTKRKFFAVPVVDSQNKLLGLIKADQLIGQVQQEATEDLLRMFGAGGTEKTFSPMSFSLRKRLPWLHVNLATAFLAASVVAIFESTIAQVTALAVFLPVVAGQGGNAGAQSLAIVMRGLVMREIPKERFWSLVTKESIIGIVNGLLIGAVTGVIAYFWHGNLMLGVVIAMAMVVNLFAAGMSGAAIPLVMKSLGLDPAQSSSIVLTTVTDVVGFLSFLGFASLFMKYLM